jgi:hypothetical protein
MTGNTTATQQNGTLMIPADSNTSITYATTYVDGGGATAMAYKATFMIEELP